MANWQSPTINSVAAGAFQMRVQDERRRQDLKWGDQSTHTRFKWLAILAEELGEIAEAVLEDDFLRAEKELIETAAVCQAAFEFCFKNCSHD